MEPAGYDPRVLKGMGLSYATSGRGACHLRTTFYKPELAGTIDPASTSTDKVQLLMDYEDRLTIYDCLILCKFYRDLVLWDQLTDLIHVTTGLQLTEADLRSAANRITREVWEFNYSAGLLPQGDSLPRRFLEEPINDKSDVLPPGQLQDMITDYYRLRGLPGYDPR
ncbi:MAG: aldehyde ferredoxin oxidoreductase C-terminal domain-containing protein [Bacillota bacterium]